ncbi:MAG: epoxyqueuosine reductase QueH, partial [Deltaproteobacteria bacterium]|nr:epoxyqueuosine reductase QueH [Deltaproteobacteria bacterium]
MKILLHICCAPCLIYPLKTLRNEGFDIMGFF